MVADVARVGVSQRGRPGGAYSSTASVQDGMARVAVFRGVKMKFDDFVIGREQFGTNIMPVLGCREKLLEAG